MKREKETHTHTHKHTEKTGDSQTDAKFVKYRRLYRLADREGGRETER